MKIWIICIVLYLLSILLIRWCYRQMSSKHLDKWCDKGCHADIVWFIPIFNIVGITYCLCAIIDAKLKPIKWKIFNGDL